MKYWLSKIPLPIINIYDNIRSMQNLFFKRIPITSDNLSCRPFLIVSAGRSGTTLLRLMMTKHTKIAIPPESQFFHEAIRKFTSNRFLDWEDLVKLIIGHLQSKKIFQYWEVNPTPVYQKLINLSKNERSLAKIIDELYIFFGSEKYTDIEIWGDKSPLHSYYLKWIDKIFPNARYIHLVRDGRAAVNSMLNRKYTNNTISRACERWNKSIDRINGFKKAKPELEMIEIKYEDLVQKPQNELKKMCKLLNINYEKGMLVHNEHLLEMGDANLPHHQNLKKPVNINSVNLWKQDLTKEQQKIIVSKIKHNLELMGYQI